MVAEHPQVPAPGLPPGQPKTLIGTNNLMLSKATMNAAVQYYLDHQVFRPGCASKFTAVNERAAEGTFQVTITSDQPIS
jgi:hypothetical protein